MFDTVNFVLRKEDAAGLDLYQQTQGRFDVTETAQRNGGDTFKVKGTLQNYKITVGNGFLSVWGGSLCRYYLGDNMQTLGRRDTQRAIEQLSDTLNVPMEAATITRLDVGANLIMQHPIETYTTHLGTLQHTKRLEQPNGGLYYSQKNVQLCFYDKIREQKSHRNPIAELYNGCNVLRYEYRYLHRLPAVLKRDKVTASMLYDANTYCKILDNWAAQYKRIKKIKNIEINFEAMSGKKDLYTMGVLSLIERVGGVTQMIEQINIAYRRGKLSKKAAHDLRDAVKAAMETDAELTTESEALPELDEQVKRAILFYR